MAPDPLPRELSQLSEAEARIAMDTGAKIYYNSIEIMRERMQMTITEQTSLRELLAAYPWLLDAAIREDEKFRVLDTAVGKLLLKKATVSDLSKRSKIPVEELIGKIEDFIRAGQTAPLEGV